MQKIVIDNNETFISDLYNKNKLTYKTNGGSTGQFVGTWSSKEENQIEKAFFDYKWSKIGYKPYSKIVRMSYEGIKKELKLMNNSAAQSLEEGLEETLTLQRLGIFAELGTSFKTTNCIENLNRQIEQYTGRVCRWKTSDQRQRWVASALGEIEPRLRMIKGHRHLKMLRERMKKYPKACRRKNKQS